MLVRKQNRKSKKYFKYVGIVFLILGISLVFTSAFILFSPYVLSIRLVSPLPAASKVRNEDLRSILTKEKIDINSVSIATDSSYMVVLKEGGRVVFNKNKDLSQQVRSLQIILSRLTIDGKKLKSLDFRFDKPVVSY